MASGNNRPALAGLRILLSREEGDNTALARRLREAGAEPVVVPLIEIVPVHVDEKEFVIDPAAHDWVVVTSSRAVAFFCRRIACAPGWQIAAVGPSTADALAAAGWPVHFRGNGQGAAALMEALHGAFDLRGRRILHPCSARSGEELSEAAERVGARVQAMPVYDNRLPAEVDASAAAGCGLAVFYSPSAVDHYCRVLRRTDLPDTLRTVAIGSTTRRALHERGARWVVTAAATGLDDVMAAIAACATLEKEHNP
jgi:uroporphyrinogen-III synthase